MKNQTNEKPPNARLISLVFGATLLLVAIVLAASFNLRFWISPPAEKLNRTWASDLQLLESSHKLPKQWDQIREVTVKADNSVLQDWLHDIKPPIKKNPAGRFRLDTFLVFFIEGNRYGTLIQYHLIDLANQNTVWEDGRTFKLGIIY